MHWVYIDDWIVQLRIEFAVVLLDVIEGEAALSKLRLQRSKCAFHVPSLAAAAEESWPPPAAALLERIPHRAAGLILLGTDASGDRAMPLDQCATPPQTLLRKERALRLGDALLQMVQHAPLAGACQAAFAIARGILSHALDFDLSVLPSCLVQHHAFDLDVSIARLVAATFGKQVEDLSAQQLLQLRLPTRCAGLQVDMPSHVVPLARAAALVERGPAIRAAVQEWQAADPADTDTHTHTRLSREDLTASTPPCKTASSILCASKASMP